ncbi:MAG: transcription elongation factor GreA [Acetobacteraceae bacterium]|nr:transcription elongation factor GreA [Acetobacteraceae bacterium]
MVEREVILSPEGLKKLEQELETLKSVKRREIAQRIKQARELGGIDENSEYENAKNEQAFIEGRILTLERILRNARLMDEMDLDPDRACIGSRVRVRDLATGAELEYSIVGATEADPATNRISHLSPVAQAILGQKAGSVVQVNVPAGVLRYEILDIKH